MNSLGEGSPYWTLAQSFVNPSASKSKCLTVVSASRAPASNLHIARIWLQTTDDPEQSAWEEQRKS